MLFIILNWFAIGFICFTFGQVFHLSIRKFFLKDTDQSVKDVFAHICVGLAVLYFITYLYFLFFPVQQPFFIGLLIGAIVISFVIFQNYSFVKKFSNYKWLRCLLIILLSLLFINYLMKAAFISATPSPNYDDGLYYRQFINWINQYSIIPGLGNIHFRLANNSTWHLLSAVFSYTFFKEVSFNDLNGFVFIALIGSSLQAVYNLLIYGENRVSNYIRIFSSILLVLHKETFFTIHNYFFSTAPAADFPAAVITWTILVLLIEKIESADFYIFDATSVYIAFLTCFVLTIKLSIVPISLAIVLILYVEIKQQRFKNFFRLGFLLSLFVLPWLIGNIILSGYLIFPFYQIDLFNVDWKIPPSIAHYALTHVGMWAKVPGRDQHNLGFTEWFPNWYHKLEEFQEVFLYLVVYAHLIYLIFLAYTYISRNRSVYNSFPFICIYIIILLGVCVWFTQFPDLRFGYGFTSFSCLLFLAILCKELLFKFKLVIGLIVIFLGFYFSELNRIRMFTALEAIAYTLPPNNFPIKTKKIQLNLGTIYLPAEDGADQCWDASLPCAPAYYSVEGKWVRQRGKSITSGYWYTKIE
jgi:hypothetical protein